MLKKIIAIVVVVAIVIGAVIFLGTSGPWEEQEDGGQGARFAMFAILKDGSEVPLTGDALLPQSITRGGETISAIRITVQVRGASPDYDEYRLLAGTIIQFRIGQYVAGSPPTYDWFSTNTIHSSNLFGTVSRIMPFDNIWVNLPNTEYEHVSGWGVDASFDLIVPASFIQDRALAAGLAAPSTLIFEVSYNIAWDVPEDPVFTVKNLSDTSVLSLSMVEGTAGLEGDIAL